MKRFAEAKAASHRGHLGERCTILRPGPATDSPFWAMGQVTAQTTLLPGIRDDTSEVYLKIPAFNLTAYKHSVAKVKENPGYSTLFKSLRSIKWEKLFDFSVF